MALYEYWDSMTLCCPVQGSCVFHCTATIGKSVSYLTGTVSSLLLIGSVLCRSADQSEFTTEASSPGSKCPIVRPALRQIWRTRSSHDVVFVSKNRFCCTPCCVYQGQIQGAHQTNKCGITFRGPLAPPHPALWIRP